MKNKLLVGIIFCIVLFSGYALADMGPKPSVVLELVGIEDEDCRVTILSNVATFGLKTVTEHTFDNPTDIGMGKVWQAIQDQGYEKDGWKYVYRLKKVHDKRVEWEYHPPQDFRIVIYFSKQDVVVISKEILTRYAFRSYFQIRIRDGEIVRITNQYNFQREILLFLIRLFITLAIEMALAFVFGFGKKQLLRTIVKVNVWTQVGLNLILLFSEVGIGTWLTFLICVILEIPIFLIEANYYVKDFKKRQMSKNKLDWVVVYAFVANLISFIAGIYIPSFLKI